MARIKQKGKSGAAKAYITRSSAIKKLQCSIADFRRLCILKGIFPREPRHRKRANKGSSAPTSFYYAKDIAYLAHEPVLKKLREHKAFAKKLARALGRGEWSSAKSLEESKPVYRLDHIIKERYPSFVDALRDIDDALCLVSLFASLPSSPKLPPTLIENCSRLSAEWQLYIMHSRALRKVFLSIKGVYYEAEVMEQTVNWLVPYQFTQNIPTDVDVRVMLTFLELYQTLLGFVFFKLYTDAGLVYPPSLDDKRDESGAGVGAFSLQTAGKPPPNSDGPPEITAEGKKITEKDIRRTIKSISSGLTEINDIEVPLPVESPQDNDADDDFVPQTSSREPEQPTVLPTLQSLLSTPQTTVTNIFSPFTFYLSRETSRPLMEFIVRSFGGRIGWPPSSGAGSPIEESDERITHIIIDRPLVDRPEETEGEKERRRKRKYVQPQWIVDCVNAGKILLEDPYEQGKTLPPHLSPFEQDPGAYEPVAEATNQNVAEDEMDEVVSDGADSNFGDSTEVADDVVLQNVTSSGEYPELLRAAELQAEAAGVDFGTFEKKVDQARKGMLKKGKRKDSRNETTGVEENLNKMMMSRKQRKLYDRMKFGESKRVAERTQLEQRKKELKVASRS
ncbi:hypothetical protein BD410DRAFT_237625 [Rickenella mellea]|uniref:Pescadillo homolog n=1 Tax=Rickenella mellea TaxID=50990 RepID=A0A4Y7QN39_9AGAM|nr:hypothetical protein BD410DRAFT_237625 [Rickenella mellea]